MEETVRRMTPSNSRTDCIRRRKLEIFPRARAYIEGESSEFFEAPQDIYIGRKL